MIYPIIGYLLRLEDFIYTFKKVKNEEPKYDGDHRDYSSIIDYINDIYPLMNKKLSFELTESNYVIVGRNIYTWKSYETKFEFNESIKDALLEYGIKLGEPGIIEDWR